MKNTEYKEFRNALIESEFAGDIMCAGYMFLRLTDKQVDDLKKLIPVYAREYTKHADGSLQVGIYVFK